MTERLGIHVRYPSGLPSREQLAAVHAKAEQARGRATEGKVSAESRHNDDARADIVPAVPSLRRTEHAFFTLEDDYVLDPVSLLRGIMPKPAAKARIVALAALTGERHSIDQRAWEALVSIPIDGWVDEDRFDTKVVRGLLEKGLIVSDSSDTALTDLRERDKALTAAAWHPDAGALPLRDPVERDRHP